MSETIPSERGPRHSQGPLATRRRDRPTGARHHRATRRARLQHHPDAAPHHGRERTRRPSGKRPDVHLPSPLLPLSFGLRFRFDHIGYDSFMTHLSRVIICTQDHKSCPRPTTNHEWRDAGGNPDAGRSADCGWPARPTAVFQRPTSPDLHLLPKIGTSIQMRAITTRSTVDGSRTT